MRKTLDKLAANRTATVLAALAALLVLPALQTLAQTVPPSTDDTTLKQIIIFGRHGVRSAAVPYSVIQSFAARPYPDFGVPAGYLTPHGAQAEVLLGGYFRAYLRAEGLLTGDDRRDAKQSYFRANSIQRSNISAASLAAGLLPDATVGVHSYALGTPDPIFDPISAKVVTVDGARAAKEVAGIFGSGSSLASAYSGERALIRSVLFNYPLGTVPAPATPAGLVDVTAVPVPLTANTTGVSAANAINAGGLTYTLLAADPFVMEYTDGLPMDQVAWGQLSLDQLSQQTRIITLDFDIQMNAPYLNQLQSSNAAAHILRSMEQEVYGTRIPGAFSGPKTKLLVINSSDAYVEGLASLLHLNWDLPGYQPEYCAPGGSLVFELRESNTTGKHIVRAFYTAQTFDQLRNLTPLTLDAPPATQQLLIPGGNKSDTSLDVDFDRFHELVERAIDPAYVQSPEQEVAPGVLTGVPLTGTPLQ
jgi:4-phytase/acid phosphatase